MLFQSISQWARGIPESIWKLPLHSQSVVSLWLELPIRNSVLSDPPKHKAGCAQQHSIIKGKWCLCDQARAVPEGTSMLHEVVQMSTVPSPAPLAFVSQPGPLTPCGASDSQLTEEDETQGWFTSLSAQHTRTTKKRRCTALQPLSGSSLKNSGHRKSSQCAELPAVHLVVYFGRRNGQICNYILGH